MCWRLQLYVLEAATIVLEAATICADCNHMAMLPGHLVITPQVLLRADPVPSAPMPGMFLGALP